MSMPSESAEPCAGCGLRVPGGTAGCQAIMDELVARDFSEVLYFRVHRMMVDTYSLQHPDRYCAGGQPRSGEGHIVMSRSFQSRNVLELAKQECLSGPIGEEQRGFLRGNGRSRQDGVIA